MHEADGIRTNHDIATSSCRHHNLTLVLCARRRELWSMVNTTHADDGVARHLPPEILSGPTVNINGGSIIDVARDYHNHQNISIHHSQPG